MTIENKTEMVFRLPNIEELKSLLWTKDDDACQAAFRAVFDNTSWETVWSSSSNCGVSAWSLCFLNGNADYNVKSTNFLVRLVRNSKSVNTWRDGDDPSNRYHVSKRGHYVIDHKTGLEWKRDLQYGYYTWHEAIEAFGPADDVNQNKQIESPVDKLVSDVFQKYGYDNSRVIVTTCASVVRVERPSIANCYLQKEAAEPDSLWKVYVDGNYVCGMETLHDGFRVPLLIKELTSALENKIA